MRATKLEPGNLAYFIDVGRALLAARRIPEATRVADVSKKLATTPGDRSQASAFSKQIDYRVSHPQDSADTKASATDASQPESVAPPESAKVVHAEGQITELLCGHPPEIILTLTTGSDSVLLHVADIGKISIQDSAAGSDAAKSTCAKWKDRKVKVDYRAVSSGMASGEIQNISLD